MFAGRDVAGFFPAQKSTTTHVDNATTVHLPPLTKRPTGRPRLLDREYQQKLG